MQNNITELTQKLLGALDSNYNVIDMGTVVEVITILEKVSITKELLETTRLGKHVNELRRNTQNENLAKRAKELVKKWRNNVLPVQENVTNTNTTTTNGQIQRDDLNNPQLQQQQQQQPVTTNRKRQALGVRSTTDPVVVVKKPRINGASNSVVEYEFSDSSNSSFKDAPLVPTTTKIVVVHHLNSDSNSSTATDVVIKNEPAAFEDPPRKRGRKKGSKNHKNLLDEAETSFSNKMAVSRGNAKVKTTQELIASLQNRTMSCNNTTTSSTASSPSKNIEDWNERAAKLTERVSLIDQKLNASGHRLKRRQMANNNSSSGGRDRIKKEETNSLASNELDDDDDEDEIVIVDDDLQTTQEESLVDTNYVPSLSYEEALQRLPPIDHESLNNIDEKEAQCLCSITVKERHNEEDEENNEEDVEDEIEREPLVTEDPNCPARIHLQETYRLNYYADADVDAEIVADRVAQMHTKCIESVNGNFGSARWSSSSTSTSTTETAEKETLECSQPSDLLAMMRIVPNFYELPAKCADTDTVCENYKKYCFSEQASRRKKEPSNNAVAIIGLEPSLEPSSEPGSEPPSDRIGVGLEDVKVVVKEERVSICNNNTEDDSLVSSGDDGVLGSVINNNSNNNSNNNNNCDDDDGEDGEDAERALVVGCVEPSAPTTMTTTTDDDNNKGDLFDRLVDKGKFCEYHEVLDRPSYNDELLRILPYVVID